MGGRGEKEGRKKGEKKREQDKGWRGERGRRK